MSDRSEPDAVDDACCLYFRGDPGASSGVYEPTSYALHLRGDSLAEHHLTHLHEIHHKALNDDTRWGTALHVAFRHPQWRADFFPALRPVPLASSYRG